MQNLAQTAVTADGLDPAKMASGNYHLLMENDRVRVFEIMIKAGERVAMHSNHESVIYVFNDGRLKHTYPDGSTRETLARAGTIVWDDAETHATENIGDTDIHSLKIELK